MIRYFSRGLAREDVGAYAILYALLVVLMVGLAALVIDIASMRETRRQDRASADAAALAGASVLGNSSFDIQTACTRAMRYAEDSLNIGVGSDNCLSVFQSAAFYLGQNPPCPATANPTPAVEVKSGYTIKVIWPVQNGSVLMTNPDAETQPAPLTQNVNTGAIGTGTSADDGTPCARLAVLISHTTPASFSGIFGGSSVTTISRSVGLGLLHGGTGLKPAPLVVLDPTVCEALRVNGGSQVTVTQSNPDPTTGEIDAGAIYVDSNGTTGCGGNASVIDANGGGAFIHALDSTSSVHDAQINDFSVTFHGGGGLPSYNPAQICAGGVSSSNPSAAGLGNVCPQPVGPAQRLGRTFIDDHYNCATTAALCIAEDIPNAGAVSTGKYLHINQLAAFASWVESQPVTNLSIYRVPATDCGGPAINTRYPPVDLPTYTAVLVPCGNFGGGNGINKIVSFSPKYPVIFGGNVKVSGGSTGGCLIFNPFTLSNLSPSSSYCPSGALPHPTTSCPTCNPEAPTVDAQPVYVDGNFAFSSGAGLIAPQTIVQVASSKSMTFGAGTTGDSIYWTAPKGKDLTPPTTCSDSAGGYGYGTGTYPTAACFRNLAFWTESSAGQSLSGQSGVVLEGTWFAPNAPFTFNGGTTFNGVARAQFIADTLLITGGGTLYLKPDAGRTNPVPFLNSILIR